MKPLYIKKNGQVEKVAGVFAMPASYPAERVTYDNTTSGLSADDAQGAIDEIVEDVNDKVDKEAGKGLSTNDFTNEDKALIGQTLGNNTILATDKTPFLTRQTLNPTGFSGYVREKLVGASYAWNQLCENGDFASTSGWTAQRGTISASNNVLSYTVTEVGIADVQNRIEHYVDVVQGHKYLLSASFKPAHTTKVGFRNAQSAFTLGETTVPSTTFTRVSAIFNATATTFLNMYWVWVCGDAGYSVGDVNQIKECQIIDLTLAFGSTIADHLYSLTNNGGITKLRDMGCPIDKYTPYGNGLYSVKTSGKKIVGKNLCDEVFEVGAIDNNTGQNNDSDTSQCRMHNYVPIFPNTTYVFTCGFGTGIRIYWYDGQKNFISSSFINNATADSPSNAHYLRIRSVGTYGNSYRHDMLVAIYSSGMNTTYEPYSSTTYPLGNDELRGKFDLVNGEIVASGDVKESNGEITRVRGRVHLGDVTFSYNSTYGIFSYALPNGKTWAINTMPTLLIGTGRFKLVGARALAAFADKQYSIVAATASVGFKDSGYTDLTLFKNSLNGVYLEYELATPTTEQSTPFADPMSLVGATTEEYIDTRDIPCPVGAERQYMGQSEDVVEIPSSPQSDGKRVLISEVSGGKEQVYWDIPTLYYKEYTVHGDGTKTYGDLLRELKPYYQTLSEDEKTYSKVMMRATSSGNECLTFVGNYWYSRMGVNATGLWLDQIDFEYNRYFKQASGSLIIEETNTNAAYNVIALRVLTYTRAE